ncbi:S-adenosylmethionine-dependent methyltransferase [Siculibacillus lacustris]|uniref:S-adenosylmethionine-dependent methyltransferase n=1 Tax=Siculibacillus lacustris TaxID=1549641 RepID=A0A4V2KSX1_9HYPH|nr:SAM-dependent methyltransferase [Siculibacillus lacustris]TBW34760.1 S-adenosylmethionine-dependent methyltransferase [Siculibacillus lacustris]
MTGITLEPIGRVHGGRIETDDDHWGAVESEIVLDLAYPEAAFAGLGDFSHAVVVFHFDMIDPETIAIGDRHPRGRTDWPKVGIFAQRGSPRPNRLGVTTVEILSVSGRRLRVRGLDAIDGTPVLDIKPVMRGFEPRGAIREPAWATEIMKDYW